MAFAVCFGAVTQCSFGNVPSSLVVLPQNKVMTATPLATINDNKPFVNLMPFGMCKSMANPTVAAATAAAMGALTPMPCVPVTASPWSPGCPTVQIAGQPALTDACKCQCAWGGVISVNFAGQATIQMP